MSTYASHDSKTRDGELSVLPELSGFDGHAALASPALDSMDKKLSSDDENESGNPSRGGGPSPEALAESAEEVKEYQRKLPKIQHRDGPGAFVNSVGQRLKAVFTPRLLLCLAVRAVYVGLSYGAAETDSLFAGRRPDNSSPSALRAPRW